jgi:hypothetical protein
MNIVKNSLNYLKNNKSELLFIKVLILVAINTWLLIIFWKMLLIENVFIGNNVALTKINTIAQPVLQILGLDILNPNILKMIIISIIIITANLMVIHLHTMVMVLITGIIARYGYKSYTNYLINNENIATASQIPQVKQIVTQKAVEQAPIIINTGASSGTNWWMWGTIIVVGVIAVGGIAFMVWSHNTNANNMLDLNNIASEINNNTHEAIKQVDCKTTRVGQYMDQLNSQVNEKLNSVNTKTNLLNEKTTNLENGFIKFGEQIAQLENNNIKNVKILSEETLEISKEAKSFFTNVMESNTASEALIVSIAKLVDGFNIVTERLITAETRIDSMTGVTTPRTSMSFRHIPTTRLNNNPTTFNE